MDIRYQEYNPNALLTPYVEGYWQMQFNGSSDVETPDHHCIPLGVMELVFNLDGSPYTATISGQQHDLPQTYITGVYQIPVTWKTVGGSRMFGIRLQAECLPELFGIPASLLFNQFAEVSTIFGRMMDELGAQLRAAPDTGSRIRVAEAFMLGRLASRSGRPHRNYVAEAAQIIRLSKGRLSLQELCGRLYISPRQLQRSFKEQMGFSPKTYMRIIRFRNAYHHAQHSPDWASITYEYGYADQAHLIRDFKEFTGAVPTLIAGAEAFYQLTPMAV